MANWKYKVNLQPEWGLADNNEISYQELAASIAVKLKAVLPSPVPQNESNIWDELSDIIWKFEDMSRVPKDYIFDVEEFDMVMDELYDWGDIALDNNSFWHRKKCCWIETHERK